MTSQNYQKQLKLQSFLAFILTIFGLALIAAGFLVPPLGAISPSVLTAVGEVFTFASACLGIDATYKIKIHRMIKDDGQVDETTENENQVKK